MDHFEEDKLVLKEFYKIISQSKVAMYERIAALRTKYMTVVLENIHQEHNASAVLRTCDCFGVQDLHVIEKNNKYKVQRDIALGAGRWTDVINYTTGENPTTTCLNTLKDKGYSIVATTPHPLGVSIYDLDISKPFALVFGTERKGISQDVVELADQYVTIPMFGFTESFNISVSAALSMNILRRKLEESSIDWKLNESEQTLLKINWSKKILRSGDLLEAEIRHRLFQKE